MDPSHLPTFFCGVTGVVHTVQGIIACTATQLGAAIAKDNLSRLKQNDTYRMNSAASGLNVDLP